MTAEADVLASIVAGISSSQSAVRRSSSHAVTDIRSLLDESQATVLGNSLAQAAVAETEASALEAELHALAELYEYDLAPETAVVLARSIDRAPLSGSVVEYLEYLSGAP